MPIGFPKPYAADLNRTRRLFAAQAAVPKERGTESLAGISQEAVLSTVVRAGREALRCSGRGWLPDSDLHVQAGNTKPLLLRLAGFRRVEATVNPVAYLQRCVQLHAQGIGPNPMAILESSAGALIRLFLGYFGICPWDRWRHEDLVDAALLGAYDTTWVNAREEELAVLVTVFFEQSVVSHALTELEGAQFVRGLAWERAVNQHPYHLLTALFERTQAMLFPKAWELVPIATGSNDAPLADALVPDVLRILFEARVRFLRGHLTLRGKQRRPDSRDWPSRVFRLAELLVPYLEKQREDQPPSPNPNPFVRPAPGDQPGDTNRQPPTGGPVLDPNGEPHPFVPQPGDGTQRPQSARGRRAGVGEPQPPRFDDPEFVDRYYSERASALVVRDKAESSPAADPDLIVVGHLDHEPVTALGLLTGPIDWIRTRVGTADGVMPNRLQIFRRTDPLEIPACGPEPEAYSLPHLNLVVDSSSSMGFQPAATGAARGKYDVVLMAAWGMFAYMQQHPNAHQVQVNAVNFSNDTSVSGWHSFHNLEPVKRVLASYKGQGTTLDISKLRAAFDSRPGEMLTVVMTDGDLGNTPQALEAFAQNVASGNHLVLLHIGNANAFTKGIQDLKCPVHILKDASQLVGLCLDLAKERYQSN